MMSISVKEVVVVADDDHKVYNCALYDLETGTVQLQLKGGHSVKHGMGCFGKDYLISALSGQPVIKVWMMSKGEPESIRMPCVGMPTALAVSACGFYCAAGFDTTIYVWHIETGTLCMRLQQHHQRVTVLRFSSDGSHLISGGKDGMVLVWQVTEPMCEADTNNMKPKYTWNNHECEVTDIFVGGLGIYSRVATASRDATCKIYELHSGFLLTCIRTSFPITAIVMDASEEHLYMGSVAGEIYKMDLFSADESEVCYSDVEKKSAFVGHGGEITCLSINILGKYLISGSKDKDCRIWDLKNFTCVRSMHCNGTVTNAFPIRTPPALRSDQKSPVHFSAFKMAFIPSDYADYSKQLQKKEVGLFHVASCDEFFDSRILDSSRETLATMVRGNPSAQKMISINTNMYSYSLGNHLVETYTQLKAGKEENNSDEEYY